ncbi:MAG: hypothetical protein RIT35_355 [Pseudomonadota bacterium]|jgi:glyoxylase I family protein
MPDNIFSINHASFIVADAVASLVFYCDVLGLQTIERPDLGFPGAWIRIGQGAEQIHLLELSNPDPISGRPQHGGRDRHIALNAIAIEPIQEALKKAGVIYTMSLSGRRALFCRDPDGNTIEIIERA